MFCPSFTININLTLKNVVKNLAYRENTFCTKKSESASYLVIMYISFMFPEGFIYLIFLRF